MTASETVGAYLREIADDRFYRRNAFRVTGLATTADARTVRERQKRVAAAAAVGAVPDGAATSDADRLRAAFETLADPARRLVHEVFWLWGDPVGCGCRPAAHEVHDRAVAAHAEALDLELDAGDDVLGDEARAAAVNAWSRARRAWTPALVDHDVLLHVRHRVQALDDRRLDEETAVRSLVAEVPRALVATIVARATSSESGVRLMAQARQWELVTVEELDDLVGERVAPRVEAVRAGLAEARRRLADELPDAALWSALDDVVDDVDQLDKVMANRRFGDIATLRQEVAVVLNNAALALVESGDEWDPELVVSAFDDAVRLSTRDEARERIETNREGATIDGLLQPYGLRARDGGVQTLADRLIDAERRHRYAEAHGMARTLLEIVDDPVQRTVLEQVRSRTAGASGRRDVPPPGTVDDRPWWWNWTWTELSALVLVGALLVMMMMVGGVVSGEPGVAVAAVVLGLVFGLAFLVTGGRK